MSAIVTHSVRPFVVMSLIGLCSLVFLYELAISGFAVIAGGDSEAQVAQDLDSSVASLLRNDMGRFEIVA